MQTKTQFEREEAARGRQALIDEIEVKYERGATITELKAEYFYPRKVLRKKLAKLREYMAGPDALRPLSPRQLEEIAQEERWIAGGGHMPRPLTEDELAVVEDYQNKVAGTRGLAKLHGMSRDRVKAILAKAKNTI